MEFDPSIEKHIESSETRRRRLCEGSGISISGLRLATERYFKGHTVTCPHCNQWVDYFQKLGVWQDVVYLDRHYIEEEPMQVNYVVNVEVAEDSIESFEGTVYVNEGDTINLTHGLRDASELPASLQDAITEEVYEQLEGVHQEIKYLAKRIQALYARQEPGYNTHAVHTHIETLNRKFEEFTGKHNELASSVANYKAGTTLARNASRHQFEALTKRINDVNFNALDRHTSLVDRVAKTEQAIKNASGSSQEPDRRLGMDYQFGHISRTLNEIRENDYGMTMNIRLAALYDMVSEAHRYYLKNHK